MKVYTKCSNYASETCPCILAESGHCLVCSICRGEEYCSCSDTVSYCIYQELVNNGGKARDQHHIVRCEVVYEMQPYEKLLKTNERLIENIAGISREMLEDAKRVHDEIEKYYIDAMDFAALDGVCEDICYDIHRRNSLFSLSGEL